MKFGNKIMDTNSALVYQEGGEIQEQELTSQKLNGNDVVTSINAVEPEEKNI